MNLSLCTISYPQGDFSTYPIVIMASLFWQLLVQMAILSPLGLTLTTAPHTSSLASSNDSPTKHKSFKIHTISHCMSRIVPFIMNHNMKIEALLESSFHLKHHELLVLGPTLQGTKMLLQLLVVCVSTTVERPMKSGQISPLMYEKQ